MSAVHLIENDGSNIFVNTLAPKLKTFSKLCKYLMVGCWLVAFVNLTTNRKGEFFKFFNGRIYYSTCKRSLFLAIDTEANILTRSMKN